MNKIRFSTIGMGRKGLDHIQSMTRLSGCYELAAVCDHAPERLEKLPECAANAKKYAALDELLADDSIEMVTLATRHLDHVPMAIRVLESGRICGIEKPVASSVREMMKLKECADRHPGKLFLLHNRRFEPAFLKARALAESGMFGTVNYIKLYRSVGYCRRNDWMTIPELYGGLLTNWGPHLIDQALTFLDSPVKGLWADMRRCISIGAGDDLFKIVLKAENGRVADVEVSGANAMPGREMEIICSRGTIVFENGRLHSRAVDPAVEFRPLQPHRENPPLAYGNFDEKLYFVETWHDIPDGPDMWELIFNAVRKGEPYPIRFEEGLATVRVTEEAIRFCGFEPLMPFTE